MIEAFYSSDLDSASFFDDLRIAKSPNYLHRNQYPVITLSFKNVSSVIVSDMIEEIYSTISGVFKKWAERILPCCNEEEARYVQTIVAKQANRSDYIHSFDLLCRLIGKTCGKKPRGKC